MLRNGSAPFSGVNALTKKLEALSLATNFQTIRWQTRMSPRGWKMSKYYSFKDRYWSRARHFPPNWADDHHLFYPSLKEVLKEKENIENPIKKIDIGHQVNDSQKSFQENRKTLNRYERRKEKEKQIAEKNEEHLLNELITKDVSKPELDYDVFLHQWLFTEGVDQTQTLAHHYQIYRDLFSSPSQISEPDPVPKVDIGDFYPRPDVIEPEVYEKHFPGAVRSKTKTPKLIYEFKPIVPMNIEFAIPASIFGNEKDDEQLVSVSLNPENTPVADQDELVISPVYRGNLIKPRSSQIKPNIVIDTSAFSDTPDSKNTFQQFQATEEGKIKVIGNDQAYYSVCLLSLDGLNGDSLPVCHWMQGNLSAQDAVGQEFISYLTPFAVKGLGYHRYVFVLFRHQQKITVDNVILDNILSKRQFDPLHFIKKHSDIQMTPVGLNWFQSTYDSVCKDIFHHKLNMKMPTYEYIQPKMTLNKQLKFPGPAPFNLYLDHFRDPKEISKEVVLQRLSEVNPFSYHSQIQPRKLPPNIYKIPYDSPSWLRTTIWKKRNQLGAYRLLRPASALIPHNNQADLDNPMWPHPSKVEVAMRYPFGPRSPIPLRLTKWSLPLQEHPHLRIQENVDVAKDSVVQSAEFDQEIKQVVNKKSE